MVFCPHLFGRKVCFNGRKIICVQISCKKFRLSWETSHVVISVKPKDTRDYGVDSILWSKMIPANSRLVKHNVSSTQPSKVRICFVIYFRLSNIFSFSTPRCF